MKRPIRDKSLKDGFLCSNCGRTVTENEYCSGETTCCKALVIVEEEHGICHANPSVSICWKDGNTLCPYVEGWKCPIKTY